MTEIYKFKDFFGNEWNYISELNIFTNELDCEEISKLSALRTEKKYDFFENISINTIFENINVIIVEITRKCNFKCKYCYVPKSNKSISDDVINKAINFINYICNDKRELTIAFGTGEPLLEYEYIRNFVERISKKNPNIKFTLTTNASTLNDNILDFLNDYKFTVVISIDGPPVITNFNRDRKAYEHAMREYNTMVSKYKNIRVGISTVIYNIKDLHLIDEINLFLKNLKADFYIVSFGLVKEALENIEAIAKNFFIKLINNEELNNCIIEKNILWRKLVRIYNTMSNFINFKVPPLGICIPGERMLIGYDGNLYLCEKTLHRFKIGNLSTGLSEILIKKLLAKFIESIRFLGCDKCYAKHYCSRCFNSLGNHVINYCELEKIETVVSIKLFTSMLCICNYNIASLETLIDKITS